MYEHELTTRGLKIFLESNKKKKQCMCLIVFKELMALLSIL